MTRPKISPDRLRFETARATLGLARWQMRLLEKCGRLAAASDGSYGAAQVESLAADPSSLRAYIADEERLVSTQACKLLGTSPARFREAARSGVFTAVESVPWRYGTVLRYRRRDIEDGAAAFGAWMTARRNAVRDVDPARSLRRRQQRGRAQASRQMIIDALQSQLAAAEQLPPPQAGLGVVAIWFDRLISYHEAISAVKARSRSHGRALAARRSGLAVPLEAAAEFLVGRAIAGEPHLRATICGGGRIVFCPTCAAAARRARIARADGFGIPGCPDCLIDNASLGVFLEIDLPGLYTLFETDLATASAWSHLGPRDDVRAPSRLFAQEAAAGLPVTNSGYVLCQPPGISDAVWRAADRDTRMALWQTWQESVRAARLAGELPTEILPRHITGLARSRDWIRGPISSYRPPADRRARQVLPEARLIEQLAGALAAYSGNAFILGRA